MKNPQVSNFVAGKIKAARTRRNWTRAQLAVRCGLTDNVIEGIETGRPDHDGRRRRDITVDELLAVAGAFEVGPLDLLPSRIDLMNDPEREAKIIQLQNEIEAGRHELMIVQHRLYEAHVREAELAEMMDKHETLLAHLVTGRAS